MSRETRGFGGERPLPRPVERIELTENKKKLRLALMLLFGTLGVVLLTYAFMGFFTAEDGWQTIEAGTTYGTTCAEDFTFQYYLGGEGVSASAQKKQLVKIYSTACADAHKLFHDQQLFEGVANVAYINAHPGEEISVDPGLYKAFENVLAGGNRRLYMGPVYDQYRNLFAATEAEEEFDPAHNPELQTYFDEILTFSNDSEQIELRLLGDNKVMLYISEACKQYSKENEITSWIDFFWMKNAYVIDYLADCLLSNGLTLGRISSYDGFARMLSAEDTNEFTIYKREGNTVTIDKTVTLQGAVSIVLLHDYPLGEKDSAMYKNGLTPYISPTDGRSHLSTDTILLHSDIQTCGELLGTFH